MTLSADPTLAEIREALAMPLAANAAFDGWKPAARDLAADTLGVDRDVAALALPDALAMIDAWFAAIDRTMTATVPPEQLATLKVREKITALVEARLTLLAPHREALRRALAILAAPTNFAHGVRLGWRAADVIWRAAGDTAVDYNHYTKRAMLAAVYAATTTVLLDDESEGQGDTRSFLARRIAGIMRFEKAKGQFLARNEHRPSLSRFIGRLRYPAV